MYSRVFLVFALALASPALAQTAPADTAHFYKHHLGLAVSPQLDHFFTANRNLPVSLLYKHQTKLGRLWRYGLVLNQDYSSQEDYNPGYTPSPYLVTKLNPEFTNRSYAIGVSVGREYARGFSRRWTGTAGVDAGVNFSQKTSRRSYQVPGNMSTGTLSLAVTDGYRERYYQATLAPFVGLRFQCWPQLYLSAESAMQAYYLKKTLNSLLYVSEVYTNKQVAGIDEFSDGQVANYIFNINYHLVNQISVHYMLGRL